MVNIILSSRAPKLGPDLCRFIINVHKKVGKGHKMLILCKKEQVERLDRLLWEHPNDYFLPHSVLGCGPEAFADVFITSDCNVQPNNFVLVNLTNIVHECYYEFFIIIELAGPGFVALNDAKKNIYLASGRLSERSLRKLYCGGS